MTGYGPVEIKHPSSFDFFDRFPDEDSAREYLTKARWPDGVLCAHCGHDEVYRIRDGKLFRCKAKECGKQFTVRIGTVMEDSPIPLRKWLFAMYLFGIHHKGIAATKLADLLGVSYKTAYFMGQRLRCAFEHDGSNLSGTVEVDETYLGGKRKNMPKRKRKELAGRGAVGKQAIVGLRERGGRTVAMPVDNVRKGTLKRVIRENVVEGSQVYTDGFQSYNDIGKTYRHESVNHHEDEYVRGDVHTNSVESDWGLLKRAYTGVYHAWCNEHSHRYVNETLGRRAIKNLPAFDDGEGDGINMICYFMAALTGKRLTYAEIVETGYWKRKKQLEASCA